MRWSVSEPRVVVRWCREILTTAIKAGAHLSLIMFAPCCEPGGGLVRETPQQTQRKCVLGTFLIEECGS